MTLADAPIAVAVSGGIIVGEFLECMEQEYGITNNVSEILESGFQPTASFTGRVSDCAE